MRTIRVAAAVIRRGDRVFATARGYGAQKGGWEFPGGKIEAGETSADALLREIREELGVTVTVGEYLQTVEYEYPDFHLSMDAFFCELPKGEPILLEAEAAGWFSAEELRGLSWLPADVAVMETVCEKLAKDRPQRDDGGKSCYN